MVKINKFNQTKGRFLGLALNKRGVVFEEILWIPNIIFLMVVIIVLLMFINTFANVNLDTSEIEPEIFVNRLLYSNNALNYCDEIRCYPGIIDYKLVSNQALLQKRLNGSFHSSLESKLLAFHATLYDDGGKKLQDFYFNKVWYDRWKPLTFSDKYSDTERGAYILYSKDGKFEKGVLKIDLVMEVE